jgi:hypothetical protein
MKYTVKLEEGFFSQKLNKVFMSGINVLTNEVEIEEVKNYLNKNICVDNKVTKIITKTIKPIENNTTKKQNNPDTLNDLLAELDNI